MRYSLQKWVKGMNSQQLSLSELPIYRRDLERTDKLSASALLNKKPINSFMDCLCVGLFSHKCAKKAMLETPPCPEDFPCSAPTDRAPLYTGYSFSR